MTHQPARGRVKIEASEASCINLILNTPVDERQRLWNIVDRTFVTPYAREKARKLIFESTTEPYPE